MAKFITILMLFILAFAGTILGALSLTGNLNQETLKKLMGKQEPAVALEAVEKADEVGEKALSLKKREEEVEAKAAQLKAQEDRLKELIQQNEELRDEVSQLIAQMSTSLDEADAAKQAQLQEVSKSLEKMKAKQAALTIETWTPEDAARVLLLMGERQRGAILDGLDPEIASRFLQAIQKLGT
ncbi:MAG: hypothetical protein AMXMBFR84_07790 [Candidatus Hydrogenedentota bacterium]